MGAMNVINVPHLGGVPIVLQQAGPVLGVAAQEGQNFFRHRFSDGNGGNGESVVLAVGQLVGQVADPADHGTEHWSAGGQFYLQVGSQAGDGAVLPGIGPFAAELAVLVERPRPALVLDQADAGQGLGDGVLEFGQSLAQLSPGERRRLRCQHDFQIGVFGHAFDQAVRL